MFFYIFLFFQLFQNHHSHYFMAKTSKGSAAKGSVTPQPAEPESFEAASAELEQIVTAMEAGQLSLEASLAAYRRGAELLQYCQQQLQTAQQQVRILEADMLKNHAVPDTHEH